MLLEIGPGPARLGPEWKTLDCVPRQHVDFVARWGEGRLPIDDGACELVYASHVAEHLPYWQTVDAFCEVHRILKPGGRFEVWVPDFAYILECYLRGECGDDWRRNNPAGSPMLWAAGRIFAYNNGGAGEQNWHRAIFDETWLKKCLWDAGFIKNAKLTGHERGHRHGKVSLGCIGAK
jgi:predicted SAM-dependent methyltransferase